EREEAGTRTPHRNTSGNSWATTRPTANDAALATTAMRTARPGPSPLTTTEENSAARALAQVPPAMTYSGVPIRKTWVHTNQTIGWLTRLAKTTIAAARARF